MESSEGAWELLINPSQGLLESHLAFYWRQKLLFIYLFILRFLLFYLVERVRVQVEEEQREREKQALH